MFIREIQVRNFKRFEDLTLTLNPQFNLLVSNNGSGKTSALDALAVAMGSWMLGIPKGKSRPIHAEEIRECVQEYPGGEFRFERPHPALIEAHGTVIGQQLEWTRSLRVEEPLTLETLEVLNANLAKEAASPPESVIALRRCLERFRNYLLPADTQPQP